MKATVSSATSGARIASLEEFWPYYVGEHRDPINRLLHYVGTSCALLAALAGVLSLSPGFTLAALFIGYGPAWIGHFLVERNRPATFQYPLWSMMSDFKMLGLALRGRMDAEVERLYGRQPGAGESSP